ncbi:hypothetical protein [Thiohalocapsa sp. ML1]|uniref:hypothetical protein n=1 Tax=Thiohalocapsa sp. ML1 TaxID=1431688 RepID=UPI0012E3405D|nr:hypothetical protein [Thiohalocapsa sp. ML1]
MAAMPALLTATFLAYAPGINGPFLLDDHLNIDRLETQTLNWSTLRPMILTGDRVGGLSRALSRLTLALTLHGSGSHPPMFKYQNLMLHLANGLLIVWFAALVFSATGSRLESVTRVYLPALGIAAIWLLHPLQVSTVLYAVQRMVILSAFFLCSRSVCTWRGD